jgi:hypothetical protein
VDDRRISPAEERFFASLRMTWTEGLRMTNKDYFLQNPKAKILQCLRQGAQRQPNNVEEVTLDSLYDD